MNHDNIHDIRIIIHIENTIKNPVEFDFEFTSN